MSILDSHYAKFVEPEPNSGCWLWVGANNRHYGTATFMGVKMCAHRLSYEMTHGPIPKGEHVMHNCDNGLCVNPAHLSVGDRSTNMRDAAKKLRCAKKLTPEVVRAMRDLRRLGLSYEQIAAIAGVSGPSAHYAINRGWSHVLDK